MNPDDYIITRKRKKYKFARFFNYENCFEQDGFDFKKLAGGARVVLEIGAGTGLFAVELAARHPENYYIATDVKADRLQVGAKKALEEHVANIAFVRVHTESLPKIIPEASTSEIWLTFSDPFPKKRHAKHRLTHPAFLRIYKGLLAKQGALHQKTDNHALFDWSLEQFVANGWCIQELSYDLHNSSLSEEYKIMTSYEKRWMAEDLPIHYLRATVL